MKIKSGIIVHCENKKQAKKFIKEAYKLGYRWACGNGKFDKYKTYYNLHKENTCYIIRNNNITFASTEETFKLMKMLYGGFEYGKFEDLILKEVNV